MGSRRQSGNCCAEWKADPSTCLRRVSLARIHPLTRHSPAKLESKTQCMLRKAGWAAALGMGNWVESLYRKKLNFLHPFPILWNLWVCPPQLLKKKVYPPEVLGLEKTSKQRAWLNNQKSKILKDVMAMCGYPCPPRPGIHRKSLFKKSLLSLC